NLDMIVLTHAHLDHSGYLPVMARLGFSGPVLATASTCELCGILLPDSGHLQEEDARFANKRGFSKHRPALPLYTEEEARRTLALFRPLPFDKTMEVHERVRIRYFPAAHILGASFLQVRLRGKGPKSREKIVLFSGDLGRPHQPIIKKRTPLPACDHLLVESTYGNRDHPEIDPGEQLAKIVRRTVERGGSVLIPAFAVGRTQELLYTLRKLQIDDRLPSDVPIYVDSPMAIHAIRIYMNHPEAQDLEMHASRLRGEDPLGLKSVRLTPTVVDSKAINDLRYPAIVISASGMATGGRVLHHLANKLPDHRNTVVFVGYQAAGTRGRRLQEGAREIRIHGREIEVRADVETLDGLSAHADRGEIMDWLRDSKHRPRRGIHVVHGEPDAADALAARIEGEMGLPVNVPDYRDTVEI
ncbi:MAG: MBL fold metallo-hydrolase, partial [Acidobacteriota bacterium]|nr:MBL fold metallo-hydrolase [Acidobacteriota bacterium]